MSIEAQHIWSAIDDVAERNHVSVRELATRAGLHYTALYKRKKGDEDRWPTSHTLAATLSAAGVSFAEFGAIVDTISRQPSSPASSQR
jgi:DNA-binding phage protein